MTKKLLVVVLVAGLAAAAWLVLRGRGHTATTTTAVTTTASATIPVSAYFYRAAALVPVVVRVPKSAAVATAALRALLAGPPSGYQTGLPPALKFVDLTIANGTARATFSRELKRRTRRAEAQIVYTLTQFSTVHTVEIAIQNQGHVELSDSLGEPLHSAVRENYVDQTAAAPIFVKTPTEESTVSSPVQVTGTAVVFEATLAVDIYANGKLLRTATITASAGAPERGTWATTLDLPPGTVVLHFYEPSAQNGSHLHETGFLIYVKP